MNASNHESGTLGSSLPGRRDDVPATAAEATVTALSPRSTHGVSSPSEPDHERRPAQWLQPAVRLPRGSSPLQRTHSGEPGRDPRAAIRRVCLTRLPSASRVSHPPGGLLPPELHGLVSCRSRSWGCDPPELFPHSEVVTPLGVRNPPAVTATRAEAHATARLQGLAPRVSPSLDVGG